jgi:hypothetical protein
VDEDVAVVNEWRSRRQGEAAFTVLRLAYAWANGGQAIELTSWPIVLDDKDIRDMRC